MALVMSVSIFVFGTTLLAAHGNVSQFVLKQVSIPVTGSKLLDVYPHLGPVLAAEVPFPSHRANPMRTVVLFVVSLAGLILAHRSIPLGRNFVVFLTILLCAAAGVIIFSSTFYYDSAMYTSIWLRGQILVWILLPWLSAFTFIMYPPSLAGGIAWTLLLQFYAFIWSPLRLVFCLGVLHYTGILFLPLLWFCLGPLFDFVCLVFFYSFAVGRFVERVIGERVS
jgi:hypothetical protein